MKYYQFYKVPNLDAKVGVGMKRNRFTFYFPAKGTSKRKSGNVARNPDRLVMHYQMILNCQASRLNRSLVVLTYEAGKAIDGEQMTFEPAGAFENAEFSSLLPKDLKGRGNYAYTLHFKNLGKWGHEMESPEYQCQMLAIILGLEATTNARKVSI
mgnify:CR=1 FL=1